MITGTTQLLGVIGDPIRHSLSPVMHNAAIAHLGVDYVYVPFPVATQYLGPAIDGFAAIGLRGFNITIPHKQAILPYLHQVSAVAQAVGAVNTVWRTEAGWSGTNTDVEGFLAPLKSLDRDWSQAEVVVLGNGGAARAVVAGCAQLGCAKVSVVGRDRDKLAAFQASWELPNLITVAWPDLTECLPQAALVVNTTPIGMSPRVDMSPCSPEEMARLPATAIAYDLIYTPNPTQFLRQAAARGAMAIDGLEMLVQQGAAALSLWLGQPAPVEIMRRSLRQYLGWE